MRSIKFALIGASLVLIVLYSRRQIVHAARDKLTGAGALILLLICAIPGFIQTDNKDLLKSFLDFIFTFITMWSTYALVKQAKTSVLLFGVAALVISAFCALTLASDMVGFPGWKAPAEYAYEPLAIAGFGARRTGWSNGVALFLPLSILLVVGKFNRLGFSHIVAAGCCMAIIGSQFVVAGRAGLLASVAAVLIIGAKVLPKKQLIPLGIVVALLYVAMTMLMPSAGHRTSANNADKSLEETAAHLRMDRLNGGGSALNKFSAGRLDQFGCAISMVAEQPMMGYGFGKAVCMGAEIHNLWLKMIMESGILLPSVFMTLIGTALLKATSKSRDNRNSPSQDARNREIMVYKIVLLQGVVVSMFEPNALIGSFQATAVWWAAFGALRAISDSKPIMRDEFVVTQTRERRLFNYAG